MTDLLAFGAIAAVFLAAGIGLGMLVAPRLTRLAEGEDEEPDDQEPDDQEPDDQEPDDEGSVDDERR